MDNGLAREIYRAFERLDAGPELLALIGSIGDTLGDDEIAQLLKDYNDTGECVHPIVRQ